MRRLSSRVGIAALAMLGGYAAARMLATQWSGSKSPMGGEMNAAPSGEAAAAEAWSDGNALLDRVLAKVEWRPNLTARFRQSLRLGDDSLSGAGEYWQQGVGNLRRTCWQWTTLVAGQMAAFRQVYDSEDLLWTDVRMPDKRTVTRVNLSDVRRELSLAGDVAGQGGAGGRLSELELLARGGLSQLIAELRGSFTFGPAVAVEVDDRKSLAVVGRWRPEALQRDWPHLNPKTPADWPAHLPHHVVVVVGELDFFPYVVEYRTGSDAALVDAPPTLSAADPLARYEFFEVSYYAARVANEMFEFPTTDVLWHDVTARVITRLRPPPPTQTAAFPGVWRQ